MRDVADLRHLVEIGLRGLPALHQQRDHARRHAEPVRERERGLRPHGLHLVGQLEVKLGRGLQAVEAADVDLRPLRPRQERRRVAGNLGGFQGLDQASDAGVGVRGLAAGELDRALPRAQLFRRHAEGLRRAPGGGVCVHHLRGERRDADPGERREQPEDVGFDRPEALRELLGLPLDLLADLRRLEFGFVERVVGLPASGLELGRVQLKLDDEGIDDRRHFQFSRLLRSARTRRLCASTASTSIIS